jgi:flagellar hook-length control protein FliK
MRFSVPSVAEAQTVLPSRPNLPSPRTYSNADAGNATPFADLLDSPPPAPEPPPAPRDARTDRPDRPADQPKPADMSDKRNAEAKPAKDNAGTKDAQDSKDTKDSTDAKTATDGSGDAKSAQDAKDANTVDAAKDAKDPKAAGDKPKADADQTAALDAMFVDAATPAAIAPQAAAVAVVQPLVLAAAIPEAGTPEADALAALQAAAGQGPRVAPDATKPDQMQGSDKPGQTQAGDKPADASAKGAATAAPAAAVPEIESGKDGETHGSGKENGSSNGNGNSDKALSEFHRAAAELLTKVDVHAPAQSGGDAASAVKASTDAVQNLGVATPANATNPATAAATAAVSAQAQTQAPAVAVPLFGLAVEIVTHADAGRNHFEIRLDPPDLGRINVKLDVDSNGNVTTHLVVDRADTLDLLKRDASSLERALQQAGLKTSDHALDFSLRQHSFAEHETPGQTGSQHMIVPDDDPAPLEALRQGYGRLLGLGGGLDIRV